MMNKDKYPKDMFWFGVMLNMVRTIFLPVIGILLSVVRVLVPIIPVQLPAVVFCLWPLAAVIRQLKYRSMMLDEDENDGLQDLRDIVLDNDNWKEDLRAHADQIIRSHTQDGTGGGGQTEETPGDDAPHDASPAPESQDEWNF